MPSYAHQILIDQMRELAAWTRRAIASVAFVLAYAATLQAQPVRVGVVAPDIDLPALGGGRVQLSALRGRPIIVSFWGTWCPPCRAEFPELVKLHDAYAAEGLVVLGVNGRDQEIRTKNVQAFVDEHRVRFPIALDERGRTRQTYRLVWLPTTVFIDSLGIIQRIHMGPVSQEDLIQGAALLGFPRPPAPR